MGLTLFASVLTTAYVLILRSPASDDAARTQVQAPPAAPDKADKSVKLEADDQEKGGIETAAPKEIAYQEQVRAYGLILSLDRLTYFYNEAATATQQLKVAEVKLQASQTANARARIISSRCFRPPPPKPSRLRPRKISTIRVLAQQGSRSRP